MTWRRMDWGEGGGATIEMVLATPLLIALALTVIALGRFADARNRVTDAAHQAARATSITRGGDDQLARHVAASTLAETGVACRNPQVSVHRDAHVARAIVRCDIDLADLTGIGLPGHRAIASSFSSPIDPWRTP